MPIAYKVQSPSVFIRTLPYPYKNALAISNDPDGFSIDFFEYLMNHLTSNDSSNTLGEGLNLRIDSGYFAYSPNLNSLSLMKLQGTSLYRHSNTNRIIELITRGLLNTNHSLGDHDSGIKPERHILEQAVHEILTAGGNFNIWTNHGNAFNSQCIGSGGNHHDGDIRLSNSYHTDLWVTNKVQFYSSSHLASGGSFRESLKIQKNLPRLERLRNSVSQIRNNPKKITTRVSLRDDTSIIGFARFRGTGLVPPNLSNLNYQMNQIYYYFETYKFHATILYQHLGVAHKKAGVSVSADKDFLTQNGDVLRPLLKLSKLVNNKLIWNPRLLTLLIYSYLLPQIRIKYFKDLTRYEISLPENLKCYRSELFNNMTVYLNNTGDRNHLSCFFDGIPCQISFNLPDETGNSSFTINGLMDEL